MVARLHQHLHRHVRGNTVFVDQTPQEGKLRVRRRGETHLDLLEAHAAQQIEKLQFFLDGHRLGQRLIAIPQVHGTPFGRLLQGAARPRPVGQVDRWERMVFA